MDAALLEFKAATTGTWVVSFPAVGVDMHRQDYDRRIKDKAMVI